MRVEITKTREQAEKERLFKVAVKEQGCPSCGAKGDYIGYWNNLQGGLKCQCLRCGTEWNAYDE